MACISKVLQNAIGKGENLKAEVFDERKCLLGEGPTSRTADNSLVMWVDIHNQQVHWRDTSNNVFGSFTTAEQVGFALPRKGGGTVLGVGDKLILRDPDGAESVLESCNASTEAPTGVKVRWNDAKIAPGGELFAGSMAYDITPHAGALYRISDNQKDARTIVSEVTISNGLDWTVAGDQFCYIDTLCHGLDIFDYSPQGISERRRLISFDQSSDIPDGMCIDAEDGIWVAFCGNQKLNRYSLDGTLTESVVMPVKNITSCCFAGENLDLLICTTAALGDPHTLLAGMTLILRPGVRGQKIREFV